MARPVIAVTTVFASDALYTTGPVLLIGTATKIARPAGQYDEGFVGDEVPPAQEFNQSFFELTTWSRWVGQGSSAGAEDDHIVETDTDGKSNLAQLDVLGHSVNAGPSLSVVGSVSGAACDIDNTNGNFACIVTSNASLAALRGLNTGTGYGVEGVALGTNNTGVRGSGTGTGSGVEGDGGSTGNGGEFNGGSSAGHGVVGIGNAIASAGVRGEADPTSAAYGVQGIGTHVSQTSIIGMVVGGADSSAIAVHGNGGSDATGVRGSGSNGYGVVAASDPTTPTRSALRVEEQDTNPSTALNGDVFFKGTDNRLRFRADGIWREVWSSLNGYTHGHARDLTGGRNSAAFATVLSATLAAPNEPSLTGTVVIKVSGRFRNAGAPLNTVRLQVLDATAGAVLIDTIVDVRLSETNALVTTDVATAYEKTISFTRQYALPLAGVRTFDLQIATLTGGGTGVDWADLNMEIDGAY